MPKKILLADDSITIQKVVELTFSDGDYEVVAVNNGARAIQKLSEMRPDIILSDIIMPEKNGYEVCEYVKSHPDLRTVPVVLLTGTFEPFDPDRADKAGCDAVVTKPFESQSLIQRVEELIQQSRASAAGVPAGTPWIDEAPASAPAEPEPAAAVDHGADIFAAPAPAAPAADMPFETPAAPSFAAPAAPEASPWDEQPAFGNDAPQESAPAAPAAESSPWDEQPAYGGETRAFPAMSFDQLQQAAAAAAPPAPEAPAASAWDDQPAFTSNEPSPLPPLSFGEAEPAANPEPEAPWDSSPAPAAEPAASSPWDEQPVTGGETRAFPAMSFDDLQRAAAASAQPEAPSASADALWDEPAAAAPAEPEAPASAETSPWDEQPAFSGETRAFPKMSFDDLRQMGSAPAAEPEPAESAAPAWDAPAAEAPAADSLWDEPATASAPAGEPAWSEPAPEPEAPSGSMWDEPAPPAETAWDEPAQEAAPEPATAESAWDEPAPAAPSTWSPAAESEPESAESFSTAGSAPFMSPEGGEEVPFGGATEEPSWSPAPAAEAEAQPEEEPAYAAPAPMADAYVPIAAPPLQAAAAFSGELSEEQVDRIARRVVELLSDKIIRDIAWEVVPDTAQMVVKERIRQLEGEA